MRRDAPVAIWDFDGVLCDSLVECIAVTLLGARMLEAPQRDSSPEEIRALCNESEIAALYLKLGPLRPYIVRGQDYLWQYRHFEVFKPEIGRGMAEYQKALKTIYSDDENALYERTFYTARRNVAAAFGSEYQTFFRAYDGALDALRHSIAAYRTYICTNRDQNGVSALLSEHGIAFPRARIFSKDFNGEMPNTEKSKTDQVFAVLDAEGGRGQRVMIVEDQVKTPAEIAPACPDLAIFYASYGYGLMRDWQAAKLPHCIQVTRADRLLPAIRETMSR